MPPPRGSHAVLYNLVASLSLWASLMTEWFSLVSVNRSCPNTVPHRFSIQVKSHHLVWRDILCEAAHFCTELHVAKRISILNINTLVHYQERGIIHERLGESCASANTDCWTDWQSFTVFGCSAFFSDNVSYYNELLAKTPLKQTENLLHLFWC